MPFVFSFLDHFTEGGWDITRKDTKIFSPRHVLKPDPLLQRMGSTKPFLHSVVQSIMLLLWYIDLWLINCYFFVCISVIVVIWFSKNLTVQWTGNTSTLAHDTLEGLSCNNSFENSDKNPKHLFFFLHYWLQIQTYMGESSKLWNET